MPAKKRAAKKAAPKPVLDTSKMSEDELREHIEDLLRRQDKEARAHDTHKKGSKRRAQAKRRLLRIRGELRKSRHVLEDAVATRKKKEARQSGPLAATRWAVEQEGISESPAGSNLGPGITEWQRSTGYNVPPGVFWCGCFVKVAVVDHGKAKIPTPIRVGYNGFIEEDARAGRNGLKLISKSAAHKGCIATMTYPHIVLILSEPDSVGYVKTAEGNTSPDDAGSQYNGGCVAVKRRHLSEINVVAAVAYPKD